MDSDDWCDLDDAYLEIFGAHPDLQAGTGSESREESPVLGQLLPFPPEKRS